MGRRSKYTPDVVKRLTDAVGMGATYDLACKYAGVTFETFNQWRKAKPAFSEALEEAEGRAAVGWLAKIERAANEGTWQAAAWKLERRYPQDYGRIEVHQQGTVEIAIVDPRERLLAEVQERRARIQMLPPPTPEGAAG